MWNATYADLIASNPKELKFYKGDRYEINSEVIILPQSLISINGVWCLEKPRTIKEKQEQPPDRERFLVPLDINNKIQQTPLAGNPYTLFKKGKTIHTQQAYASMIERYQESLAAIRKVDGRVAIWQVREKRNESLKIELVDRNLKQDGYMDLIEYIEQLPPQDNSFEHLWHLLLIVKASFILLNSLHIQHNRTYGDFKPDNIMINPTTGIMCFVDYENSKDGEWIRAGQGTYLYSAPEIFLPKYKDEEGMPIVHRMVDNFAAGVMLSILVGIVESWNSRLDLISTYLKIVQDNPDALNNAPTYDEYFGALISGIDILDKPYTPDALENIMIILISEMGLDDQFVDTNDILINIIKIIANLTRLDPEHRISLDIAISKLDETIIALQQRYQMAQQQSLLSTATTTAVPLTGRPNDTQDMEVDESTGQPSLAVTS